MGQYPKAFSLTLGPSLAYLYSLDSWDSIPEGPV